MKQGQITDPEKPTLRIEPAKPRYPGIGHTSWVLAQRPSMGVILNRSGQPRSGEPVPTAYDRSFKDLQESI